MILTVDHDNHPAGRRGLDADHRNRKILATTLVGIAVIAAAVLSVSLAGHWGFGPNLGAVVYLVVGLAAVVLWVTYMITHIEGEIAAGLSFMGFWAAALVAIYLLFYAFG